MSRPSENSRGVWDTLLIVAVAALAVTFGQAQQALADEEAAEERIVEIAPNNGGVSIEEHALEANEQEEPVAPAYWLGIEGGPLDSPILRTHLQLADDVGVVVRQIVPGSPAEKAGLKQHDILISVGGDQITDMGTLQQAVAGSHAKPLDLKVLRLAKEVTVTVTPEETPKDLVTNFRRHDNQQFNFQDMPRGDLQEFLKQFQEGGIAVGGDFSVGDAQELIKRFQGAGVDGKLGGGVRVFGPGMILKGQHVEKAALPGGVAVTITREGEGPAKITVKKGDESWTVEGNDQKALKELPDDVRPFVQQMLQGSAFGASPFQHQFRAGAAAANPFANFDFEVPGPQGDRVGERILNRLEKLEQKINQFEKQFQDENPREGTNIADDPSKT